MQVYSFLFCIESAKLVFISYRVWIHETEQSDCIQLKWLHVASSYSWRQSTLVQLLRHGRGAFLRCPQADSTVLACFLICRQCLMLLTFPYPVSQLTKCEAEVISCISKTVIYYNLMWNAAYFHFLSCCAEEVYSCWGLYWHLRNDVVPLTISQHPPETAHSCFV